jgi:hypothetical protein
MYQPPVAGKAAPSEAPPKGEPGKRTEKAAVVEPGARLARIACAAVLFAVAATEFISVVLTRDIVIASLWAVFGFGALATGVFLYKGRFNAWGTAMILDVFAFLLALVVFDVYVIGALLASFVVLYLFRLPFGVGAWKIESTKENDRSRTLISERTQNPAGVRCPKCGADTLWVAGDGSAFCLTCRAGTIELVRGDPS